MTLGTPQPPQKKSKECELWLFKKYLFKFSLQSLLTKPYPSGIHKAKALLNPKESKSPPLSLAIEKSQFLKQCVIFGILGAGQSQDT